MRLLASLKLSLLLVLGAAAALAQTREGPPPNPFAPPQATVHFAPDRDFDLLHLSLTLNIDYPNRKFDGTAVNQVAALHDALKIIKLHCGTNLDVRSCSVGSYSAPFKREGELLLITAPKPLSRGEVAVVTVRYASGGKKEHAGMMADSGLHWIEPSKGQPDRVGLWTQGEPDLNRQWAPTWDYPNDMTTTETTVTVPADWTVIGNGALRSNRLNAGGKTRTFHWQMSQPHATYLLSLVAGPFDVKMSRWRDVPLMYVAPKGKGKLLEYSFGNTPDMLSFYSDITGVKYAWPKYAQDAMYDFGGGMENVSATTLPESALTDPRAGAHTMDDLNAHELAHQWFGDLVTCKDWGQIWLNESFATFFGTLYAEHSRGEVVYAQQIEGEMQGYIHESRRYRRPIATNLYPNAEALFDAHTYPKGAAVLHTLRRMLGDRPFFAGIHAYLTAHRHTPVDSHDLCRSMTEASGVNLEPFWDQWISKPGHPVLDTSWSWDENTKQVVLTVKQIQDTKDGTPIYTVSAKAGLITAGKLARIPILLNATEQVIKVDSPSKPDAVLVDPDHDFLREIPAKHWSASELPYILKFAAWPADRADAMAAMLSGTPAESAVQACVEAVRADTGTYPVFQLTRLGELKREDLRPLFRAELRHASLIRREEAIRALALLPKMDADFAAVAALVSDREPYSIITASVAALAAWDPKASLPILKKAAEMPSLHEQVRAAAYAALANAHSEEGVALLLKSAGQQTNPELRTAALGAMGKVEAAEPRTRAALLDALKDPDFQTIMTATNAIRERKDKALLPALQELKAHPPAAAEGRAWFKGYLDELISDITKA